MLCRWEGETKIGFYQRVELPPERFRKADVSSVSPSSERIEELWGVVGLFGSMEELCHWWKYGDMNF